MSEAVLIPAGTGVSCTIYGTVAARNAYLSTSRRFAAAWAALSTDDKNRVSVDVMQNFNVRGWKGAKTSEVQLLAWPRTGATDGQGAEIAVDATPAIIETASYLMTGLLTLNPDLFDGAQLQGRLQSLREGQVGASFYFAPPSETADNSGTPTAAEVEALIAGFLGDEEGNGMGTLMVPFVSGTDNPDNASEFGGDKRYTIQGGLS
jgi:hypothetical protein